MSILPADREVGEHLVSHPEIDKVTFTGSTAAGRRIMSICGERIARVTLELGGKSAAIIADDVPFDAMYAGYLETRVISSGDAGTRHASPAVGATTPPPGDHALAPCGGSSDEIAVIQLPGILGRAKKIYEPQPSGPGLGPISGLAPATARR